MIFIKTNAILSKIAKARKIKMHSITMILMLLILLLNGCMPKNPPIREQQKEVFLNNMEKYCEVSLDNTKDWYVATIYFDKMQSNLSNKDKDIIKQVANVALTCNKPILLISSISEAEAIDVSDKTKFLNAFKLSNQRLNAVKQALVANKVYNSYINTLSCSTFAKRVYENMGDNIKDIKNSNMAGVEAKSNQEVKANQFVEIIFLNTRNNQHKYDCFVNNSFKAN